MEQIRSTQVTAADSQRVDLETMYLETKGPVATITLNRPEKLNAGNLQWVADLGRLGSLVARDSRLRVVIIRGAGRAFSSGIDLKVVSTRAYDFDWFRRWEEAITAFEVMEKITIAAIHGYCLGGGLQLALACDLRIAREDAILGLPAALEGMVPGLGPYRLARHIGLGRAKQLSLTGENVNARTACDLGMVNYFVTAGGFEEKIAHVTQTLLDAPVTAQLHTKKITNMAFDLVFREVFAEYLKCQKECANSPDHAAAATAYRGSKGLAAEHWGDLQ